MEVLRRVRPGERPGRVTRFTRRAIVGALLSCSACTPTAPGGRGGPGQRPAPQQAGPPGPEAQWPVQTKEHLDLWLHGYAMLLRDSAQVPVFRRGYRDAMSALRRKENVLTSLDANHLQLAAAMGRNPEILNGQFLPMYFASFEQMQQTVNSFLDADGNPRQVADPNARTLFAAIASAFPTAQDREWLRLFMHCLEDESAHFFHQYWLDEQMVKRPSVVAADSVWQSYRLRFKRFLDNSQQSGGDLLLSTVLGGEGRTVNFTARRNVIAVTLPESPANAAEPIYVFAHEAVQVIATPAVNDNTSPAEQRSGAAALYLSVAAVRGGAMLIQRVAPELADGYMRYYLRQANGDAPVAADLQGAFSTAFQLPSATLSAMARRLDVVLGGI
jgi:hypothetical protein